ncbi:hypothetical protein FE634_20800 [Nocardioides dongxiaopingii]|uniref:hypothetical protein n=1 Tax=Nocardioides sp. S-1144 TaxID=2582905 RepID=UPI00110F62D2|nr:hypothetical protein [Nocardioides sp. S-1144]QCW52258.1 hypothetical protein FE634_20800 [Nocardioides sp. S-1144]
MSIPPPFRHLVDDAAIFPPGLAPLPDAVAAHAAHLRSDHAALVGPFLVDAARLDDLGALAPAGLAVSVVVPAPDAVTDVVARAGAAGLVLAGLEVKLGGAGAPGAQVAQVAELSAGSGVPTHVEVPRVTDPAWPAVLDAVLAHGLRLKFRTGGTEAAAFPFEAEVGGWIEAAVAHGVPFKCTAGLHHAVRHTGPATGFEHHGYLNILLATARALAGAPVAPVLAERDGPALARAVALLPPEDLLAARAAFTSYGSCSILEPLEDLTALHLLHPTDVHPADVRTTD